MRQSTSNCGKLVVATVFFICSVSQAFGQTAWGYADVFYDPVTDKITGTGISYADYGTQYYYDPLVSVSLSGSDGFYTSYTCVLPSQCNNSGYSIVSLFATPTPGASYTVNAVHRILVHYDYYYFDPYCTWGCSSWYDAYGFSSGICSPACRADPYCYCVDVIASPPYRYWYPPYILILSYVAEQYLGENEQTVQSPVPLLQVRNGGTLISSGQSTYLSQGSASTPPQMPALTAQLVGQALVGTTTWRMSVQYTDHNRYDADEFPSGGRVLSSTATWDVRSDTGGNLRGGTATIRYRYSNHPERTFTLNIRGANPSETDARSRLGGSPWFLTRIARQESGIRQFNGTDPLFGAPNGWGLMQLDPPPSPEVIWNWWANVDAGKNLLATKQSALNVTWANRIDDWNRWNTAHPDKQVGPPPDRQESGCLFKWNNGDYGNESVKSFRDACWIKRYNGAARDYLYFDDFSDPMQATWVYDDSAGYVRAVCGQSP